MSSSTLMRNLQSVVNMRQSDRLRIYFSDTAIVIHLKILAAVYFYEKRRDMLVEGIRITEPSEWAFYKLCQDITQKVECTTTLSISLVSAAVSLPNSILGWVKDISSDIVDPIYARHTEMCFDNVIHLLRHACPVESLSAVSAHRLTMFRNAVQEPNDLSPQDRRVLSSEKFWNDLTKKYPEHKGLNQFVGVLSLRHPIDRLPTFTSTTADHILQEMISRVRPGDQELINVMRTAVDEASTLALLGYPQSECAQLKETLKHIADNENDLSDEMKAEWTKAKATWEDFPMATNYAWVQILRNIKTLIKRES